MSANLDLVRSIYTAWERGELFNQDDWADPGIEFEERDGPDPSSVKGVQALKENMHEFMNTWVGWRIEGESYRELPDGRILVLSRVTARGSASELRVEHERAAVFELREGRVVRYVTYWDRDRALADLGLEA